MPVSAQILRQLLQARPGSVSGKTLGENFGLSRVSIKAHIDRLREAGIGVTARSGQGYTLEHLPLSIHPLALEALTEPSAPPLYFYETLDSTNSEAERLLAQGTATPFVVIAGQQTAGRGRLGRTWESAHPANLYLSLALRPQLPPARMQTFTLWMGLSLCRWLRKRFSVDVRIKWPNDLWVDGRKLAGMLTEARIDADRTRDLVFGLGLNLAGDPRQWPKPVQRIATCLQAHLSAPLCVNQTVAELLGVLHQAQQTYLDGPEPGPQMAQDWPRYCALLGTHVEATAGHETFSGTVVGITTAGALRLERPDGSERLLHGGEVTLGKA